MRTSYFEVLMGGLVIVVAIVFAFFAVNSSRWQGSGAEQMLYARFERIDGLAKGTDVRVSGVKIGAITDFTLDPQTFFAIVTMRLDASLSFPTDTVAEIASEGLLGGKYLSLIPGVSSKMLAPGATIARTQAALNFESLISKFLMSTSRQPAAAAQPSTVPTSAPDVSSSAPLPVAAATATAAVANP